MGPSILYDNSKNVLGIVNAGDGVRSMITNGREPRSCLGRVFNLKLGSFTYNTKIAEHANGHI